MRPDVEFFHTYGLRISARPLSGIRVENWLRSAVIESVFDLATERFGNPQAAADLSLLSLSSEKVTLARSKRSWATPNANVVASALAKQAARAGLKTIVFVQQADHAPANAKKIADALDAPSARIAFTGAD